MTQIQAAIAILHQDDQFLMQLRDEGEGIIFSGLWGFFGGHIEPGESPDEAIRRELLEEIGHVPPHLEAFQTYPTDRAIRHVYQAPLTVPLTQLDLQEGQDLQLLSIADIRQGEGFAKKLQEMRAIAPPHRAILLEFWEQRTGSSPSYA